MFDQNHLQFHYHLVFERIYLSCMTRMNWCTWFSSTSSPSSFLIISAASYLFIRLSTFVIVPLLTPSDGPLKFFWNYFIWKNKIFWGSSDWRLQCIQFLQLLKRWKSGRNQSIGLTQPWKLLKSFVFPEGFFLNLRC